MSQKVCIKILELKSKKKMKEMVFVKKNKTFIIKLLNSETRLKMIQTGIYEYVKIKEKWYEFNLESYYYQEKPFF